MDGLCLTEQVRMGVLKYCVHLSLVCRLSESLQLFRPEALEMRWSFADLDVLPRSEQGNKQIPIWLAVSNLRTTCTCFIGPSADSIALAPVPPNPSLEAETCGFGDIVCANTHVAQSLYYGTKNSTATCSKVSFMLCTLVFISSCESELCTSAVNPNAM